VHAHPDDETPSTGATIAHYAAGDALNNRDRVDTVVGWRQAGGDLATVLASRYALRSRRPQSRPPRPG
jgi:hypothetical protein